MVVRKAKSGVSLALVLVVAAIIAVLATAMTALFTSHLNLTQIEQNRLVAAQEAESGLNEVLNNLAADPAYGTNKEQIRTTTTPGLSDKEAYHLVTFDSKSGDPYSVNNLNGSDQVGYKSRAVPAGMVHVLVTGFCRGQVRTLEAVVQQPPFSYAMAMSGPIISAGPLYVEGTESAGAYLSGGANLPGHIASNAPGGIKIGADAGNPSNKTFISGRVEAVGSINIAQPATVKGGLRPNSAAKSLPSVDILSFDNASTPGIVKYSQPNMTITSVSQPIRCASSTNFTKPVSLSSGVVFVKGDATFQQGVQGQGVVIVDGDLTLTGAASSLSGDSNVALLATGKISVDSGAGTDKQARDQNYFQGLVYSKKGIKLENITVMGAVILDSPDNTAPGELNNVKMITNPEATQFDLRSSFQGSDASFDVPIPPVYVGAVNGAGQFVAANDPAFKSQGLTAQVYIGSPLSPAETQKQSSYLQSSSMWANTSHSADPKSTITDFFVNLIGSLDAPPGQRAYNNTDVTVTGYNPQSSPGSADQAKMDALSKDFQAAGTTQAKQAAMTKFLNSYTTPATPAQLTNKTPRRNFDFDLNTFLPRSSTLRVLTYRLHEGSL